MGGILTIIIIIIVMIIKIIHHDYHNYHGHVHDGYHRNDQTVDWMMANIIFIIIT